ncbi:DUF4384 domain-containing protein [Neomegalonema perideroedes]|uniref:DUF4384 domain-containing protein n=1 Tax=Neomegalonema perideroedes TaxID=217219 RepID=UPI0003658125|nr:DUF4384 domain-containing protein [Neomegalonema perideroedes]
MRKLPLLLALLGGVLPLASLPLAQAQTFPSEFGPLGAKALIVEQAQAPLVYAAPAPGAERIGVEAFLSRPDGRYALGEEVELRVRVDRPSHVTVLNVDPDGTVRVLYPNRFNQAAFLQPGQELAAPGQGAALRVAPPVGREIIKVIASEAPLPLTNLTDFRQTGAFLSSQPGAAASFAKALVVEAAPPPAPAPTFAPAPPPAAGFGLWGEKLLVIETYEPTVAAPPPPASFAGAPVGAVPFAAVPFAAVPFAGAPVGAGPAGVVFAQPASGFTLRTDKASYRQGEAVSFLATTDRPCHLTLLAAPPSGPSQVIFPRHPNELRRILPGGEIRIPEVSGTSLFVNGPPRQETVIGLCATEDRPAPVSGAAALGQQGLVLAQNAPFLGAQALEALYAGAPPAATAQASVSYLVTP